jgi:antitoxin component YwqK of YwqJK toxin-antitoxin module
LPGDLSLHQEVANFYFCDTVASGTIIEYYDNGKPRAKGNFMNGLPDGRLDYYNINGKLISRYLYENGKMKKIIFNDTEDDSYSY